MTRVLVLASEVVPLPGLPTNGGGLRGWTLARGLEAAGFEVTLICPRESLEALAGQVDETALAAARPYTFAWNDPAAAVAAHQPAVAVCCSWLLASQFSSCPVPLAVDVAGHFRLTHSSALGESCPTPGGSQRRRIEFGA